MAKTAAATAPKPKDPVKRLVFFFDGTTNTLDARFPTNVVKLAQSIAPVARGVSQLIYYDRGVGSDAGEKVRGGALGHGLDKNLYEAYSFLLFNYTPGDEIYVFGFSRGAFTARSFVGLIYNCGVLRRRDAGDIAEAIAFYRSRDELDHPLCERMMEYRRKYSLEVCVDPREDEWRQRTVPNYRPGDAQPLEISYLGVWDTVAALGLPAHWWLSRLDRRKYQFHDAQLARFVRRARHAVSLDERRRTFAPTLWHNVDALNAAQGVPSSDPDAPYQQQWFPGDHGSVGGGGDIEGLSDAALDWIVDGAREAGLNVDAMPSSRIFEIVPDHRVPLENVSPPRHPTLWQRISAWVQRRFQKADRTGPEHLHEVHDSARRRWLDLPDNLPGGLYRPASLRRVADQLNELDPKAYGVDRPLSELNDPALFGRHEVRPNESLGSIALKTLGSRDKARIIFEANRDKMPTPAKLRAGDVLRIPRA
ncbi:phospholipase effector Tle1 domain-containing protein [Phenylobacterium sp.]|uniref:phospholipase effector Tle1 domain-containing protein n=1 Tax=Phenylobacterium sp. TaxID=1871053 RepID=UPI0030019C8A